MITISVHLASYKDQDATLNELGVCSDCEEVYEAEEDYWGWE